MAKRQLFNYCAAAFFSSVLLTVVVIGAELIKPFKSFLAWFTGHHWQTKVWLVIIFYLLFGFLYGRKRLWGNLEAVISLGAVILSLLAMLAYFVLHSAL